MKKKIDVSFALLSLVELLFIVIRRYLVEFMCAVRSDDSQL